MTAVPHNTTRLRGLKKRSQFLRAARGIRAGRASFALQAIASEQDLPGIGFTVTKKTGNSPERNRIKRRLRAAAGACAEAFQPQHDYVLVGRREALAAPFDELVKDLTGLLTRVHTKKADGLRNQRP
jgi:ribonuclease P protein component